MGIKEEIWTKGFIEGFRHGILQSIALKMLENQIDFSLISEITGLSEDEIKRLNNPTLSIASGLRSKNKH